jgi:hypothetical protein
VKRWKGKGKAVVKARERKIKTQKHTEKQRIASQRYAKITDLLVKGKKGAKLELAFAEWEMETKSKSKDRDKTRNTASPHALSWSSSHPRASSPSPIPLN